MAIVEAPLSVAVTVALPFDVIVPAAAVNVAVVALAGTLSEAGTVSAALLDDNATVTGNMNEAFDNVAVHELFALAANVEGLHCREVKFTGPCNLIVVVGDDPLSDAVMVAVALVVTLPAVAVNVAVVLLAATFTEEGTVKAALFDDRATVAPPAGAGFASVTLQEVLALAKVDAEHCRDDKLAGNCNVMVAVGDVPFRVAVTVALPFDVIVPAAAVNVAVVAFAGTLTEAGTVRTALLEDKPMVVFPLSAAFDSVTVQVLLALDSKALGEH